MNGISSHHNLLTDDAVTGACGEATVVKDSSTKDTLYNLKLLPQPLPLCVLLKLCNENSSNMYDRLLRSD